MKYLAMDNVEYPNVDVFRKKLTRSAKAFKHWTQSWTKGLLTLMPIPSDLRHLRSS